MNHSRLFFSSILLLAFLTLLSSGCAPQEFRFVLSAAFGEYNVINQSIPIQDALDNPDLSPDKREKLLWALNVRDYAGNQLGLKVGKSYLYYYDTNGKPAAYNLSASQKFALDPLTWTFPIFGTYEYLGYFNPNLPKRYAQELEDVNYDVVIYGAIAYSTSGILRDPLYSSMLNLDYPLLTSTIIHELTHSTVYKTSDSEFNESVAQFIGQTGSLEYIKGVWGEDSDLYKQAVSEGEDQALINHFLAQAYDDLLNFYGRTDLTDDEKIQQREQVFQSERDRFKTDFLPALHDPEKFGGWGKLPTNNAWVLLNHRYNRDPEVFEKVLQASNQDLSAAIGVFKQAAAADDPFQFLTDWLNAKQ
jgi:predicted aminopeptidase